MLFNEKGLVLVNKTQDPWLICDAMDRPFPEWLIIEVGERDRLISHFRCPLCESDPVNAFICPGCDKYFCLQCLRAAYQENANCCPHCR